MCQKVRQYTWDRGCRFLMNLYGNQFYEHPGFLLKKGRGLFCLDMKFVVRHYQTLSLYRS